ncbi:hypothetical protein ACQEVC_36210 [Plantactinospora sp. CA-294935]|uniref:hypothetical protein n=1 Tax=Plantactinospora sp. CA-294935 TaxID=3240012 RepID=UPI003D8FC1F6
MTASRLATDDLAAVPDDPDLGAVAAIALGRDGGLSALRGLASRTGTTNELSRTLRLVARG